MSEMTLEQLISQSICWESQMRDLYIGYAKAFTASSVVYEFWKQMAIDESAHGAALGRILRSMSRDRLLVPVDSGVEDMAVQCARVLEVARMTEICTLDDAYDVAHMTESSEINTVFQLVLAMSLEDEATRLLLSDQLVDHVGRLNEFGRTHRRSAREGILSK